MRAAARRLVWFLVSLGAVIAAVPWHVLLSKLASSAKCAAAPVFDPVSLLGLPSILDLEHLSRHMQALTTAMAVWAVLAHLSDGRTAAYTPVALGFLLLQPLAWIGSSTCVSLEVPLPTSASLVLYPFKLFDVDGLVFLTDPPIAIVAWSAMCLHGVSETRAVRRGLAVFICVFIGLYASVVRRSNASQIVCTFIAARILSRKLKSRPANEDVPSAPEVGPDTRFRVTDDDDDENEDEEQKRRAAKGFAGDEDEDDSTHAMPATDVEAMTQLAQAAGGRVPTSVSDHQQV
jgi:hypothetical protein